MMPNRFQKGNLCRKRGVTFGLVTQSCQQPGDRDVFIQHIPVQTSAADANLIPLFLCGMQKPGKPGQRHPNDASVAEVYPQTVRIEVHASRFS